MSEDQFSAASMAERLTTLTEIYQAINASLDLNNVIQAVMDKVIEVVKAQRGFLMLAETDGQMGIQVARGLNKEDLETPAFQYSTTIVNKVVESREPLLTSNAEHDPRLQMGQSIVALGLRSILCVPLEVRGRLIGVVYVDNSLRAGIFTDADLALLSSFAAMAGIALDNARLHQMEVANARLERELSMAYEIQRSMLPTTLPTLPGYDVAPFWRSAVEVAGDFYDAFILNDGRLGLVIADVADKGVGAALFMAVSRSLIRGNAIATGQAVAALQQSNHLMLMEDSETGMFVTVYYTLFAPNGQAVGVNAGHNCPLLVRRNGTVEWLPRGGHALGWFEDIPLTEQAIDLQPGDVLVYYTDGLTEAENQVGDCFGEARLAAVTQKAARTAPSASAMVEQIVAAVDAFVGQAPVHDDLTMLVLRYVA